jgi:hypothetical protein
MSDLLARDGSAASLNIQMFSILQHTIGLAGSRTS